MRVLLVLAMIPLLAACSVFSSSEPSATLVEAPPGTETAAGTTDTTGDPAGSTTTLPTDSTTKPAVSVPAAKMPPASAPAAKAPEPAPEAPLTTPGTNIAGKWAGSWVGTGLFNAPRQENLTLEIAQRGDAGYGRMVI